EGVHVRLDRAFLGAALHRDEVRDGDRRQDADDHDHDHQLDQSESLLATKHGMVSLVERLPDDPLNGFTRLKQAPCHRGEKDFQRHKALIEADLIDGGRESRTNRWLAGGRSPCGLRMRNGRPMRSAWPPLPFYS